MTSHQNCGRVYVPSVAGAISPSTGQASPAPSAPGNENSRGANVLRQSQSHTYWTRLGRTRTSIIRSSAQCAVCIRNPGPEQVSEFHHQCDGKSSVTTDSDFISLNQSQPERKVPSINTESSVSQWDTFLTNLRMNICPSPGWMIPTCTAPSRVGTGLSRLVRSLDAPAATWEQLSWFGGRRRKYIYPMTHDSTFSWKQWNPHIPYLHDMKGTESSREMLFLQLLSADETTQTR